MLKKFMRSVFSLGLVIFCSLGYADATDLGHGGTEITLDGQTTNVRFNDGDTFKIRSGIYKGKRARIDGYNALETPPIHEWLRSSIAYLHFIAARATEEAQNGNWNCVLQNGEDTYGRLLVTCDDLALALLSEGLAHAYSIDKNPAREDYLAAQRMAQQEARGMWANGIPRKIITSLHSKDEGAAHTYNRLISTEDGSSTMIEHHRSYATCEKVCAEQSCMVYVPYQERYGSNRPHCLYLDQH